MGKFWENGEFRKHTQFASSDEQIIVSKIRKILGKFTCNYYTTGNNFMLFYIK